MIWAKKYLWILFVGLLGIYFFQCSKLKKESPVKPLENEAEVHPTGWLDTLSADFHGNYIRAHDWDLEACQQCHGKDYAGGGSGSSCLKSGCHPGTPESCTTCHGGALNQTGAPPKDIAGHYLTKYKGVGAHTAHVSNPIWAHVYDCTECHIKPAKWNSPGHLDSSLPGEIVWGTLAKTDNLSPAYQDTSCYNVYCHGASLSGGTLTSPSWTFSEKLACNACHGLPPATGAHLLHTDNLPIDCNACHDGYFKNTAVNIQIHIDGKREVVMNAVYGGTYANGVCSDVSCHGSGNTPIWFGQQVLTCVSCHGGVDNMTGAPPVDLEGNTSRTAVGVGAHTAHVSESQLSRAYDCTECHIKVVNINDPGHIDSGRPAEIVWGALATTGNLTPNWDGSNCNNVYCHGASLQDGSIKSPQWTSTQPFPCNACHGLPPDTGGHAEHDESQIDCNICHEGYFKNISVNKSIHIDGEIEVQLDASVGGSYANGVCSNVFCHGSGDTPPWSENVTLTCTSCHGGTDNNTGAPPVDLKGNTATSAIGVGAHTMHVSSSQWSNAFDCNQCHIKPQKISDPGHIVLNQPAAIVFGPLSKTDGLSASWDGSSCTNIYCHGASLYGGEIASAQWTAAEAVTCESCHGVPPETGAHETHLEFGFGCNLCHDGYEANTTVNKEVHINGKKDVQLSPIVGGTYANGVCTNVICHGAGNTPPWTSEADFTCISCHGGLFNSTGAPPYDLKGDTTTAVKGVGAHTIHIMGGTLSDGIECSECHIKPSEVDSPGHIGVDLHAATITWGALAKTGGASPMWDGVTCQNVYCHGEFPFGNKNNEPVWINFAGTQPCGSCHGLPPASPHPQNTQCSVCHSAVVDASNNIIDKAKHINGQVNFQN